VEPIGSSGGLALLWREEKELEIYNFSRRHINAIVKDYDGNPQWKLTGYYGHPESSKCAKSWALLQHLKTYQPISWLCLGF
jgi:hypothetical protein